MEEMKITTEQLMQIIGTKEVELHLCRTRINELIFMLQAKDKNEEKEETKE